jgi:predicted MFS family arabinose efflux permease
VEITSYAAGSLLFAGLVGVFMVPFQLGALMDGLKLSAGLSSILGTAELAAMSLTSILIVPAMQKIGLRRLALIGIALAVAGEITTSAVSNLWILGAARVTTGIGSGAVLAATTTSVARAVNPDRVMGLGLTLANALFFVLFLVTPDVVSKLGYQGLFLILAACLALAGLPSRGLPQSPSAGHESPSGNSRRSSALDWTRVASLACGLIFLNAGLGAMWSFAERIGRGIGLEAAQIGTVLSACPIAMSAGSATAGLMGNRFGHRWPLLIGSLICGLACYRTTVSTGLSGYAIGLLIFNFCYLLLGPFALAGVPSTLDASGRLAAAANGLMWLAYSVGIAAGGLIADSASVRAIGTFALVGCTVAAGSFTYAARPGQRHFD